MDVASQIHNVTIRIPPVLWLYCYESRRFLSIDLPVSWWSGSTPTVPAWCKLTRLLDAFSDQCHGVISTLLIRGGWFILSGWCCMWCTVDAVYYKPLDVLEATTHLYKSKQIFTDHMPSPSHAFENSSNFQMLCHSNCHNMMMTFLLTWFVSWLSWRLTKDHCRHRGKQQMAACWGDLNPSSWTWRFGDNKMSS